MLLLARTALSQMDVPTRQAYVMALVDPDERTPAAAYTNTARYVTRPLGPPLAALAQTVTLGLPFVIGGGIKSIYDVTLWRWFRTSRSPSHRGARMIVADDGSSTLRTADDLVGQEGQTISDCRA